MNAKIHQESFSKKSFIRHSKVLEGVAGKPFFIASPAFIRFILQLVGRIQTLKRRQ
jgi:hypothetical protein